VTLMAVGDIMMGDAPICIGHGVGSIIRKRGSRYLFESVAPLLRQGDIMFGNLEAVLSNKGAAETSLKSLQLRAVPTSVEGLKFAGFNVLSLANNHIMEHGMKALNETVELLSRNGIISVRPKRDTGESDATVIQKGSLSIGFLAYCYVPSKSADQTTGCSADRARLLDAVGEVANDVDNVIVSLHWGEEFIERPSPSQIKFARRLVDCGAHLVLGHHPHVLQGVERYKQGLIAYSLGNFVFDMWQAKMRESMILCCQLSKHGVEEFELMPAFIGDDYAPVILEGEQKGKLLSKLSRLSRAISGEDLSDFEMKMQKYRIEAARCREQYRKELRKYFAKNSLRYPPRMMLQLAKEGLTRRFHVDYL